MNDRAVWSASMGAVTRVEASSWRVNATQEVSYEVRQVDGIFRPSSLHLLNCGRAASSGRQVIVIDARVEELYGDEIRAYYAHHGIEISVLSLSVSEESKHFEAASAVSRHLESAGVLRRSEPIVAIGGGVLLDLAGFAAGLYRRGIPYVKVPTNAMALWDAGVGIKTGVNALGRRNRLGSYHAPSAALLDRRFLSTVEPRDLSSGMGELLKLGVIKNRRLFDLLEQHSEMLLQTRFQDAIVAPEVIALAVEGMLEELAPNLWELTLERAVDFGHSFSPMLEMKALPELLHGEAVALDVLLSCRLARVRGLLSELEVLRVRSVMKAMRLPVRHRFFADPQLLKEALSDTMRHRDGRQRLPLPDGIGACCFVDDVSAGELSAAAMEMTDDEA